MGPLQGLKIIELAGIGPCPMCAMLLAELGADVVRVDRLVDSGLGIGMAPEHQLLNRSRPSIAVDLKHPDGVETVLRLVEGADALIEGFRPGVTERLGLGPEACAARNPRLVYGRVTGWGRTGPLAGAAGHDLNYIALTGALDAIGRRGGPPAPPLNLVGDFGGGALYLALGVVAALYEARESGQGQTVDAAMIDGAASLMTAAYALRAAGINDGPRGENVLDSGAHYYDVYETSDGRYVSIAPIEPKFYATLLAKVGLDPADAPPLDGARRLARGQGEAGGALPHPHPGRMVRNPRRNRRLLRPGARHGRGAPPSPQRRTRHVRRTRRHRAAERGAALRPHAGRAPAPAAGSRQRNAVGARRMGFHHGGDRRPRRPRRHRPGRRVKRAGKGGGEGGRVTAHAGPRCRGKFQAHSRFQRDGRREEAHRRRQRNGLPPTFIPDRGPRSGVSTICPSSVSDDAGSIRHLRLSRRTRAGPSHRAGSGSRPPDPPASRSRSRCG